MGHFRKSPEGDLIRHFMNHFEGGTIAGEGTVSLDEGGSCVFCPPGNAPHAQVCWTAHTIGLENPGTLSKLHFNTSKLCLLVFRETDHLLHSLKAGVS